MNQIIRIGMDTSKHVFQLHGVNAAEEPILRKKLRRQDLNLNCSEFPGGGLAWVTQPKIESSSARSSGPRPRRVGCSRSARAGVGC